MERKRRATTISNNISENNKTKKYLKKKRLKRTLNIILVISVSIFVICTFNILKWLIQNSKSNNILEETIEIEKNNNEELKIAFSSKYMLEALKSMECEEINLMFNGDVKPIIIKNPDSDDLTQLILPIRTY